MRRFRFQYSLRTLLLVTGLIAAALGWHLRRREMYQGRAEAAHRLSQNGWYLMSSHALQRAQNSFKPYQIIDHRLSDVTKLSWLQRYDLYWFGMGNVNQYDRLVVDWNYLHQVNILLQQGNSTFQTRIKAV